MRLPELVIERQEAILARWASSLASRSPFAELRERARIDHMPQLLVALAERLRDGGPEQGAEFRRYADVHALDRVKQRVPLAALVEEYRVLREVVMSEYLAAGGADVVEVARFASAIEDALEQGVTRHSEQVQRHLDALETVATAASEAEDLDSLLGGLLDVMRRMAAGIDSATILIREGGLLRVRASVGIDVDATVALAVGEGFSGTIAARREPMHLPDASQSPLIESDAVRRCGIRGMYGVPLVHRGEVVGVAHIGSTTASDFRPEDATLFAAVAQRATSLIAKQILREDLARRNAELEAIIQSIPDALLIGTQEGIALANRAAREMLGDGHGAVLTADRLSSLATSLELRDPVTRTALAPHEQVFARALAGETGVRRDVLFRSPRTGDDVVVRVVGAPIRVGGKLEGAIMIASDVTRTVGLERQRVTFMHAVVHDLRGPLSSISGNAGLLGRKLRSAGFDPRTLDRIDRIEASVRRLDRLLTELLDLALAEAGELRVAPTELPLNELVTEQVRAWAATSSAHRLHATSCDAVVYADRDRVLQILDNLIGNAIKYSPKGGDVCVRCRVDGDLAEIAIDDQGVGLSTEDQRVIFDPYVRAKATTGQRGHGLGLFVAAQLAYAQRGEIGVESTLGKGSTFWVRLPLARSPRARGSVRPPAF